MRHASEPGVRWWVALQAIFKFGFRLRAKGNHRQVSGSVGGSIMLAARSWTPATQWGVDLWGVEKFGEICHSPSSREPPP